MILINPDYNRKQKLGGFSRYVPVSVPIGIGYLAGCLTVQNKTARILDEEITPISEHTLDETVKGLSRPYIFGISCLTAGIQRGHELASIIKRKYPDSKILMGNIHPTVLPEEILKDHNVDIVVRGEAEETLLLLYERIKNNRIWENINGISFRKSADIIHNENTPLPDIKRIPPFPYHLFADKSNRYELGFIASSRGCPYNCIFCSQRSISSRKYRFFASELIFQSIEELINKYQRRYITFVDDSFLVNKERIFTLCDKIQQKGLHDKAIFDCQARGDTVDEDILRRLRSAGFRTIHFGIETASERLMQIINKQETVAEIIQGIKLAKKCGLQVSGTFILGLPTETKEERGAAYTLAKNLGLEYVRFNNATPYPGTKLYEIAQQEKRLNPGNNWENLNACGTLTASPFKETPLAYVPAGISEKELKHDILKFNLFYSFRLSSILKILKEKIGPAGWLTLPEKWYLQPQEWWYLIKFAVNILCAFLKIGIYKINILSGE